MTIRIFGTLNAIDCREIRNWTKVQSSQPAHRPRWNESTQLVVGHQPQLVLVLIAGAVLRNMPIACEQGESLERRGGRDPLQVEVALALGILPRLFGGRPFDPQAVHAQT